jgi:hypothetical protein
VLRREATLTARLVEAAASLFARQRTRYVPALVRSGSAKETALREAVVRLEDGRVDLAPVFRDVTPGPYDVWFQPLAPGADRGGPPHGPVQLAWHPDRPAVVPLPLVPGLYSLGVAPSSTEGPVTIARAWALVVLPEDHGPTGAAFGHARALTEQWDEAVEAGSARGFLRAFLDGLAAQVGRPSPRP